MKFTFSWLKKFLDTTLSAQEIANHLTRIGLEVENIVDYNEILKDFVVAEILSTQPHPNADNLKLCKVNVGNNEILDIVCGASNARAGIKVVLAKIDTLIPNGQFKIKASVIRGESSNGMLCSCEELTITPEMMLLKSDTRNLESEQKGIIELPSDAKIGQKFADQYLDIVFDISITPNRADCLGVYGVARDLAASGAGTIMSSCYVSEASGDLLLQKIHDVKNVNSPDWLQNFLRNIGKEPISALVDITNYMSLSFARPMHVYDASKIIGDLRICSANTGDVMRGLDDKDYSLLDGDIVIRDEEKIVAIAGIIGSLSSAVSSDTKEVILESAFFDPIKIAKTGRRLSIESDARYRFERGVDPCFLSPALQIATQLIQDICGGEVGEKIVNGSVNYIPTIIDFDISYIEQRLGIEIPLEKTQAILRDLGFQSQENGNILKIQVPSWRADVSIKDDIVEELIRIHGLENLKKSPCNINFGTRYYSQSQRKLADLRRVAAFAGFDEVLTWSFMSSKDAALYSDIKDELYIANPITVDVDYMRPVIASNLLKIVKTNQDRGYKNLSLFEVGPVFSFHHDGIVEKNVLCCLRSGEIQSKTALEDAKLVDFYDIRADFDELLKNCSINFSKISSETPKYYHPGRSAAFYLGKLLIGYIGELHPSVLQHYEITEPVVILELMISDLPDSKLKFGQKTHYEVSNYQMVSRDFAFIVDINLEAIEIERLVLSIDPKLIKSFEIFDIYISEQIGTNLKSIAFNITLQAQDRTLSEQETKEISEKIIFSMQQKFHAKLR